MRDVGSRATGDRETEARYDESMSTSERKSRSVQVELPDEAFDFHPWEPGEIASELRLLWLLEQVRQRRLGHGKAAEFSGLPRTEFLRLMGHHRISPFDYDADELEAELG